MRVLAFTTDVIPLPGLPTSGTALRTWGLIEGLRSHGHEVVVSVPRSALDGLKGSEAALKADLSVKAQIAELERFAFSPATQSGVLAEVRPDAILCGHWPAMTLPTKPSQPLIIDLAGPHMLERHYQKSPNQHGAILAKLGVLSKADYFIVSGAKQRLYFLSYLLRAQLEHPESRIATIPMPLNPQQPERRQNAEQYPSFVFGGVFLPWQNPSAGLRQVVAECERRGAGNLTLIGGKHPNYPIREGIYAELFNDLSKSSHVRTSPMLPYEEFIHALGGVDAAVDLMEWNLERELAVTIRSTTYLWAGVPVIYNDYADLAKLIRQYDAGWTIPPGDYAALGAVCDEIFNNRDLVLQKGLNASRLARECFAWDLAVKPLLGFLGGAATEQRFRETDIHFDFPDNAEYPVYQQKAIEQYFLCRVPGLTRVECRLATHNRPLTKPVVLSLFELEGARLSDGRLSQGGQPKLVGREVVAAEAVKNNEWCALDVPALAQSAGRAFMLRLEAEENDAASSLSPWAVRGSPYPLLGLRYGAERLEHAAICLRTTCAGSA